MAKRAKGRRALPKSATPAQRDAYWLEQFRAIESEGVPIKVYAEREGLAVQSLYQARKRVVSQNWIVANFTLLRGSSGSEVRRVFDAA
jgi:hypothetical protein